MKRVKAPGQLWASYPSNLRQTTSCHRKVQKDVEQVPRCRIRRDLLKMQGVRLEARMGFEPMDKGFADLVLAIKLPANRAFHRVYHCFRPAMGQLPCLGGRK
jgi:hypothetical protein